MSPPTIAPASITGRPAVTRVSKAVRHRLAAALVDATGMTFADARRAIAQRSGASLPELDAYLRATYAMDPTGVTAVRRVNRARGY